MREIELIYKLCCFQVCYSHAYNLSLVCNAAMYRNEFRIDTIATLKKMA